MDMDVMSAVGAAMQMKQANLSTQVDVSILRKTMDQKTSSVQQLLTSMPELAQNPPNLGNKLDIQA